MQVIHKFDKEIHYQKKLLQNFQCILQERQQLEKYYGQKVMELSDKLEQTVCNIDPQNESKQFLLNFSSCMKVQGEQTVQFSENLNNLNKDIFQQLNKIMNGFQQQQDHIKTIQSEFYQIGNELEQRKAEYHQGLVLNMIPRDERQFIEQNLDNCVNSYNYACQNANYSLQNLRQLNQQFEKQRLQIMKDTTMQYIIDFISLIKNMEYDISNIAKKIQEQEEINEFEVSKRLDNYLENVLPIDIDLLKNFLKTEYKPNQKQQKKFDYNDADMMNEFNKLLKRAKNFFKSDLEKEKKNQQLQVDNFMATVHDYNQKQMGDIINFSNNTNNDKPQQQQIQQQQPVQKKKPRTKIFDKTPIQKVEIPISSRVLNNNNQGNQIQNNQEQQPYQQDMPDNINNSELNRQLSDEQQQKVNDSNAIILQQQDQQNQEQQSIQKNANSYVYERPSIPIHQQYSSMITFQANNEQQQEQQPELQQQQQSQNENQNNVQQKDIQQGDQKPGQDNIIQQQDQVQEQDLTQFKEVEQVKE